MKDYMYKDFYSANCSLNCSWLNSLLLDGGHVSYVIMTKQPGLTASYIHQGGL